MAIDTDLFFKHVSNDNELSVLLKCHLWAESTLMRSLALAAEAPAALDAISGVNGPKFPTLLGFAEAFGVIEGDVVAGLRRLNVVRNKAAHSVDYEPTKADLLSIVNAMPDHVQKPIREFADGRGVRPRDVKPITKLAIATLAVVADAEMRAEKLHWENANRGALTGRAMMAVLFTTRGAGFADAIRQAEAVVPITDLPEWMRADAESVAYPALVVQGFLGGFADGMSRELAERETKP